MLDKPNPYQPPSYSSASDFGQSFGGIKPGGGFQPASTLALIICVLLGVHALCDVAAAGTSLFELNMYNQGRSFENEDLTPTELTVALVMLGVGLLLVLVYLLTVVLWCIWNVRVYKNIRALGVSRLEHSPGWAAGAWFVPFLNLFRPYQIMQEIWKGSDPANLRREHSPYVRIAGSTLVGWWWGTWILGNIIDNISVRLQWRTEGGLEMLQAAAISSIVGSFLSVICAILAIQVVRGVDANQTERHLSLAGATPAQSKW